MRTIMTMLLLGASMVYSQESIQPVKNTNTLLVERFTVPGYKYSGKGFDTYFAQTISDEVGRSGKYVIVNRDKMSGFINEQKFSMSGLVDNEYLVEVGKVYGARFLLYGSISSIDFKHEASVNLKVSKAGDTVETIPEAYSVRVTVSINLADIETGRIIYSNSYKSATQSETFDKATKGALDIIARNATIDLNKQIVLIGSIAAVSEKHAKLNLGTNNGVKKEMWFEVYPDAQSLQRNETPIVYIIVFSPDVSYSMGRFVLPPGVSKLLVKEGYVVRETMKKSIQAFVKRKKGKYAYLNIGSESGIKEGSSLLVYKEDNPIYNSDGKKVYNDYKDVGHLYVVSSNSEYAKTKIVKGRHRVKEGMSVMTVDRKYKYLAFSLYYGQYLTSSTMNNIVGRFNISTNDIGPFDIDYSEYKSIDTVDVVGLNIGYRLGVSNISYGYGYKYIHISNKLGVHGIHCYGAKEIGIIPELLYLNPGFDVGVGFAKLDVNNALPELLSDGHQDYFHLFNLYGSGHIALMMRLGKINIGVRYLVENNILDDWTYDTEEKNISVSEDLIPYQKLRVEQGIQLILSYEYNY